MLLAIDIGNTNIVFGVFDKEDIIYNFRITTKTPRTSDEYGIIITQILTSNEIDYKMIKKVIISSVVPGIMHSFNSAIIKYLNIIPVVVDSHTKTGIKLSVPNPDEIGSDRIVDCASAYAKYKSAVIVCDFGTATTYDLVNNEGEFISGITCIGIRSAANALHTQTSKLPEFNIIKPNSILAKDTISSLQSGLFYSVIGQTEYIIKKIKEESKLNNARVIATGGLGRIIFDETNVIDEYDKDLTLNGLYYISQFL